MTIGQSVLYFNHVHSINDSQLFYRRGKYYTHYAPFVFMLRLLVALLCIITYYYIGSISNYILLAVQVIYIAAAIVIRPYKRYIDYARFIVI